MGAVLSLVALVRFEDISPSTLSMVPLVVAAELSRTEAPLVASCTKMVCEVECARRYGSEMCEGLLSDEIAVRWWRCLHPSII